MIIESPFETIGYLESQANRTPGSWWDCSGFGSQIRMYTQVYSNAPNDDVRVGGEVVTIFGRFDKKFGIFVDHGFTHFPNTQKQPNYFETTKYI